MRKPELRKDYLQDHYVIIAPRRGRRPHELEVPHQVEPYENPEESIFHPKNVEREKALLTVGGERAWRIKVVRNKFPAVTLDNPKAYGTQEVVIETPDPNQGLDELPVRHIAELLEVYAERTRAIQKIKDINYILVFKNDGGRAGASIRHAHSQIFATSFVPPHIADKLQKTLEYRLKRGTHPYLDILKKEMKGPRAIWENRHAACFAPYASMHNYECWIMPKRLADNVSALTAAERRSIATILKHVLGRISTMGLSYNYYFHQVVEEEDQHLYIKVTPRGQFWAGIEIGSGIIINSVAPEDAAAFYREGASAL
ncbi:MAG: DUF4931 domain-containing protein [Parcubacteria group bacterium]|nr:DUF4931 domain-containing protein [Parcubacteria group bacterium]